MRAKTYDGDFEYLEETPIYQKCNVCEHLVHPDRIEYFIDTGMNVCEGCKEEYLQAILNERL